MKDILLNIKRVLSRKLTLMIIPHSAFKSLHLHFSFSFALCMIFFWTGLTSWATWAVVSNVDYWGMKVNYQVLKLKVHYFATELRKSRQLIEQVKEADIQLRQLLGMKDRKSIIEGGALDRGKGGPASFERSILQKALAKRLWEVTDEEIRGESKVVEKESKERLQSYKELSEYIAYERGLFRATPYGMPAYGRITSRYGERAHPFEDRREFHAGVDVANEIGTPIQATADGVVQLASWEGGYGRLVIVNHGFGYMTYYGHNSALLVKVGDRVKRGQVVAYMGASGSTTGPHTHYEVWQNGQVVNPWRYMVARSAADLKFK